MVSAKKYGYGWGFPKRWQGWVVILVWLAVLIVMIGAAKSHPVAFIVFAVTSSVVLVGICQWKGEAAKWRWGGNDDDEEKA